MKKILFSCLTASLLFMSCSDDDSAGTNNNNSPLVSTLQKTYENGQIEEIFTSEYSNGRIVILKWFTSENVQIGYTEFNYSSGLLSDMKSYMNNELLIDTEYTYDSQNRLINIQNTSNEQGTSVYNTAFTYNSDNSIVSVSTGASSLPDTTTFYMNSDGLIYKEIDSNNNIKEVTYDGTNTPLSLIINGTISTTFEYDTVNNFGLLNLDDGMGNFKANKVLRTRSLAQAASSLFISNKYLISNNYSGGGTETNIYTFNEQGLPIKSMEYFDDELKSEMEYFYN